MVDFRQEMDADDDHEEVAAELPRRAPTHPGAILKRVLSSLNDMSVAEAAERIDVTRQQLYRVISGESSISPDMAVRLGKLCGNGPEVWLRMQVAYDLWNAQHRLRDVIDKIETVHAGRRAA